MGRNQKLQEKAAQLEKKEGDLVVRERGLVVRECIVAENELLLPIVRRLQNTGMDFDVIMPWFNTLSEVAQMQRTDFRTAAQYVAYELLGFRKLGGIQKEIESGQAQLETMKMATLGRERGLNMLAELESKGVSLAVIYELSKVLDLGKIAKELSLMTNPWSTGNGLGQNGMNNGYNHITRTPWTSNEWIIVQTSLYFLSVPSVMSSSYPQAFIAYGTNAYGNTYNITSIIAILVANE